ncbi:MAG: hypothetical protein ACKORE_11255, partial [Bacteroidota bacterium]
RKTLRDIMEIQWSDNVNARIIDANQNNRLRHPGPGRKRRAQDDIYKYLLSQSRSEVKKTQAASGLK